MHPTSSRAAGADHPPSTDGAAPRGALRRPHRAARWPFWAGLAVALTLLGATVVGAEPASAPSPSTSAGAPVATARPARAVQAPGGRAVVADADSARILGLTATWVTNAAAGPALVAPALATTTTTSTTTSTTTTTAPPPPPVTAPPAPPAPPAPAVANGGVWDRLAQCEAGGNWAIDTGNGYYGGLQFSASSWHAVGGTGLPHQASRETQIAMGERLRAAQGWGAWPACSRKLGLR